MNHSSLIKTIIFLMLGGIGCLFPTLHAQELYRPVQFAGDHSLVFYPNTPLGSDSLGTIELLFRASPVPKKPPKIRRSNNSSISNGGILGGLFGRPPRQFSEDAPSPSPPNTSVRPEKNTDTLGTMAVFSQADSRNTRFTVFLNQSLSRIGLYNGSTFQSVTFDFNDGKFHHVLFVTQEGSTQVIIDGEAVGDPLEFTFGAGRQLPLHVGSADGNLHVFKGEVYVVRMWSTAVAVDDIPRLRTYGAPPKTDPLYPNLLLYSEFTQSRQDLILGQDIIYKTDLLGVKGEEVLTHFLTDSTRYIGIMSSTDSLCMPGIQFTVAGISPEQDTTFITFPSGIAFQASDSVNVFDMAMNEYLTGVHGTFDGTCIRTLRFSTNLRNSSLRPELMIPEVTPTWSDTVNIKGIQTTFATGADAKIADTVESLLDVFTARVSVPQTGGQSVNAQIPTGARVVGVEVETIGEQTVGIRLLYKNNVTLDNLDLGIWQARGTGEPMRDDALALQHNHIDNRDGSMYLHGTYTSDPLYRLSLNLQSNELTLSAEAHQFISGRPILDTFSVSSGKIDTLRSSEGADSSFTFERGLIKYRDNRFNSQDRNTWGPYQFESTDGISFTHVGTGITLNFLNASQYQLTVPDSVPGFPIKSGLYEYIPPYEANNTDKVAWGGTFSLDQRPILIEHNFKGYNIAKMNPINYQLGTGTSKMVFDYPAENSYDYYFSSAGKIVPYGLYYKNDREAMLRARAHTAASEASHQKTWSTNLGFNAGAEGASFGLNASHQRENQNMQKTENMFSIAMAHEVKYAMVLDKARMRLNPEFKAAIYSLKDEWQSRGYVGLMDSITDFFPAFWHNPLDQSVKSDTNTRKKLILQPDTFQTVQGYYSPFKVFDPTFKASLRHFIETFGTHYPYAVSYGGMAYQKTQYASSDLESVRGDKANISADAKGSLEGATVGFSMASSKGADDDNTSGISFRSTNLYSIGGEISMGADGGSWSLPDHAEVPVFLDLRPISELLSPIYFEDSVIWIQLREVLETALDDYQKSLPPISPVLWTPDTLDESFYVEIVRIDSLVVISDDDGSEVDANGNPKLDANGHFIFDGEWTGNFTITSDNSKATRYSASDQQSFDYRNIGDGKPIPSGQTVPMPAKTPPVYYTLLQSEVSGNFTIDIALVEEDGISADDHCDTTVTIPASDFTLEPQTKTVKVIERDEDGQPVFEPNSAIVVYRYWKVNTSLFDEGDD